LLLAKNESTRAAFLLSGGVLWLEKFCQNFAKNAQKHRENEVTMVKISGREDVI
jgi:hypothetical protein